jgi:hypothetical protein
MRTLLKLLFLTLLYLHANCDSNNNTNKDTQNKQAIASYISSLKPVQDSVTLSHTVALSEYSKYTGSGSEKYNYNSFTWTITKIRKVDKSQYLNGIVYADDREFVSTSYSAAPQIGDNINFSNFTWKIIDRDYNGSWKFKLQRTLSEAEDGVYYLDLNRKL